MYSPDQWEILSEVNSVTCITIVSLIFGRKLASIEGPIHYARALLLILYGLSWAFNLIACMLTSTNNGNFISCVMTHFNVALIATGTKIVLYLYFIEKIYILSMPKVSRLRSSLYLVNLGLLLPVFAVIILQIIFRINIVEADYPFHCSIGFELPASVISLSYDALLNILYAGIFIKYYCFPTTEQQTAHHSPSIRVMSKRNAIAAVISLLVLCINYIILICFNGSERGLVASSLVAIALTIICTTIHWVTTHPAESQLSAKNADKSYPLEIKQHQEVVVLTEFNRP
ncbi:hypothetical protein G6F70_001010 [Rhizopus microsporus]|uniref:G-protein coupled receptors family 1 profile domain-containing protein n=2 Tax=Rhizopus TaxID=4842 RepID=A0A367JJC9_RHIAZ|nr:hypothetical protein G6F71_008996 [Rhizopus microsporus]RCH90006.1 hypothetical protein CU097_008417 [Rhizopus azygosporus]KAG1203846.1 hypothetical protein G6F70_001010 [Rhizopus microsporus]KAG1206181.1 hypothetical protein G6F69_009019 [Rhizopus microsporus]KAG1234701.1 hypothetical protein G6F67_003336 [Rhizopus microsporus]